MSTPSSSTSGANVAAGNVRVVCRFRPSSEREEREGGTQCVSFPSDESVELDANGNKHLFTFDRCLDPESSQMNVFQEIKPVVLDVMQGYNSTMLAYGQTGSGKTHTMEGTDLHDENMRGVIPRAVDELFACVAEADTHLEFELRVSYIEIYMERVRDLLDSFRTRVNLQIREDPERGVYVSGCQEEYVTSAQELLQVMEAGKENRAVAATGMNTGSSRSHSVFIIAVSQRDTRTQAVRTGTLHLVDLAGSEMVKKTGATGQVLEEAKTINKSLSALGLVINALTDDRGKAHVPYRDSKLTRVLQNSLGGNSKTCLIINCSPNSFNAPETLSTLRFGNRAKAIQNKAVVNETRSVAELGKLLAKAEAQLELQKAQIRSLRSQGDGAGLLPAAPILSESEALAKLRQISEELTEEVAESARRQEEVDRLSAVLSEKETLLSEAHTLLLKSAEQGNALSGKNTQMENEIAALRAEMEESSQRNKFQVAEANVTISTLRAENARLVGEVRELTGDAIPSRRTLPVSVSADTGVLEVVAAVPPLPKAVEGAHSEQLVNLKREYERRMVDYEQQNAKLSFDLQRSAEKLMALEQLIEAQPPMVAEGEAAAVVADRQVKTTRALQQRLEQLVAVHRQLLRRYGQLELENGNYEKKLELRDLRIKQLESNSSALAQNMKRQAEMHASEVMAVKEQVLRLREEQERRKQTQLAHQSASALPGRMHERRVIRSDGDHHVHEVKTLRGGGGRPIPQGAAGSFHHGEAAAGAKGFLARIFAAGSTSHK